MKISEFDEFGKLVREYDDGVVISPLEFRVMEYARLNQDEMRYDDLINGTTTWQDAIGAIKKRHPKL